MLAQVRQLTQKVLSKQSSLTTRVIQGGGLLLLADLYSNGLRLAANLLFTRLLFPEAFGLMLIVNLVFTALEMLSDIGLRGSVIVRKDGVDEHFINAIWSIGIVRGVVLSLLAFAAAAPVAGYYDLPDLYAMLLIASIAPVIHGFTSIRPIIEEKGVRFRRVVIWRTSVQTLALLITAAWLLIEPSVFALAANGVIVAFLTSASSHLLFPGKPQRLAWDKEVAYDVFKRGRWIFLASGLTFLGRQGDGLILSQWIDVTTLGIFSVAVGFAKLVENVLDRLSYTLLFPVYTEMRATISGEISARLRKVRLSLASLTAPIILIFALFGRDLVSLLYDSRFANAGWMLEVMGAGSLFYALGAAITSIPLAYDNTRLHMLLQLQRFSILLITMYLGGLYFGLEGLVAGIALAQLLFYPVLLIGTYRYRVHDFTVDSVYLLSMVAVIGSVWYFRGPPIPLF